MQKLNTIYIYSHFSLKESRNLIGRICEEEEEDYDCAKNDDDDEEEEEEKEQEEAERGGRQNELTSHTLKIKKVCL